MYGLKQKLKYMKEYLKLWTKKSLGNIILEKQKLEKQIEEIQLRMMEEGCTNNVKTREHILMQELMQHKKKEEIVWQQKSRKLWLKEGDQNTRFFDKSTIQNHQHNWISQLKSSIGHVIEKKSDLEQQLVHFYSKLLNEINEDQGREIEEITRNIPKLVTSEHNAMLMRTIEREEVEEAIFKMEKGKSP